MRRNIIYNALLGRRIVVPTTTLPVTTLLPTTSPGILPDINVYGALYNWWAATYAVGGASIAPSGWHVPTKTEFETFQTYLGGNTVSGGKIKETGTLYWLTPNTSATNSSGFNGRGNGGRIAFNGIFSDKQNYGWMWSSTELDANNAYFLTATSFTNTTIVNNNDKKGGYAIRLVKDSTTLTNGQTSTMTDYDGNVYNTICIGTQEWMSSNLKVEHFNDGTPISIVTGNTAWAALTTEGMCYYGNIKEVLIGSQIWMDRNVDDNIPGSLVYQNNESKRAIYGGLYLWEHIPTIEALYPGYHVPTRDEILTLGVSVGGSTIGGGKLKQAGTSLWTSPNTGATNETGFTALPGGIWREFYSDWALEGWYSSMWTKSEQPLDPTEAYWFYLSYFNVQLRLLSADKNNAISIRLIKD